MCVIRWPVNSHHCNKLYPLAMEERLRVKREQTLKAPLLTLFENYFPFSKIGRIWKTCLVFSLFFFFLKNIKNTKNNVFRKMPFGLCNAPEAFQWCMMGIFSDMIEHILEIFIDDFSVFGDSYEGCLENLRRVLERCQEKNLVLNWEKCHFMVTQGIFLGHIVPREGIEVDKAKVELISNLPTPECVKDIQSFLGHAGF